MIDSDPKALSYAEAGIWGRATLDALFKRNLARSPDRLALCDSEDRQSWSGRRALRLTYRQVDETVSALAARFFELGLRPGAVVGVQLPNCVETVLTLLACGRAGLVPAMMPLLWRAGDVARALEPLAAKALISVTRAGDEAPADFLRYAAAELFTIRYVLAFGSDMPDGVMSLEECLSSHAPRDARLPAFSALEAPADQPALITFATQTSGAVGIERTHNHCVCAGLVTVLEAFLEPGEVIASTLMPSSLAALASSVFPWLLTGGTLALHQPFSWRAFSALLENEKVRHAVVPGALMRDAVSYLGANPPKFLRSLVGVHNDGARAEAFAPLKTGLSLVDLLAFDEFAVGARRRVKGEAQALPVGEVHHPADASAGPLLIETKIGVDGTIMVRGPQTPYSLRFKDGFRPTTLRGKRDGGSITGLTRASGIAYVGGLGVAAAEVERHLLASDEVDAVKVAPISDALFGQRIEAFVAPKLNTQLAGDTLVERLRSRFLSAGIGAFKTPSRIAIDHRLRGNPHARQRSQAPA